EPLVLAASAGPAGTRVGLNARLTRRAGAGSAGALTRRRRTGSAGRAGAPGPSGTARIGRLARSRGRTSGARARGSIGLRTNPVPPGAGAPPSPGNRAAADEPRIENADVRVGR